MHRNSQHGGPGRRGIARPWGSTTDEFAALDLSGGSFPETGEANPLIWIDERQLQPGQRIDVRFLASDASSVPGRTIDELYPMEEGAKEFQDFEPTAEVFAKLRTMPTRREKYTIWFQDSDGKSIAVCTTPADHGFALSLTWSSHDPDRAQMSLHAYSLDDLEKRTPMADFVRAKIEAQHSMTLQVDF